MRVAFGAPHAESPCRGTSPKANFDAKSSYEGNHKISQMREVSEKKVCSKDCKGRRPLIPKGHQGRGRVSAHGTQLTRFSTLSLITRSV